jgi:hypothetical protein
MADFHDAMSGAISTRHLHSSFGLDMGFGWVSQPQMQLQY